MEFDAVPDLLFDGVGRVTIGRVECIVVTIGTTAECQYAVTVGAGKTRIHADLLHPFAEKVFKIRCVSVVTAVMSQGKHHEYKNCCSKSKT